MNVHLFDWVVVVSGGGEVRGVEEGVESIPFSQCYTYDSPTSHPFFFFFFLFYASTPYLYADTLINAHHISSMNG